MQSINPLHKSKPIESVAKERSVGKGEVQTTPPSDQIHIHSPVRDIQVRALVSTASSPSPSRAAKIEEAKQFIAAGGHNDRQTIVKTAYNMLQKNPLEADNEKT